MEKYELLAECVEMNAKILDCGYFLFATDAGRIEGEAITTHKNITGAMLINVLKSAAKKNRAGMMEVGIRKEVAEEIIITTIKNALEEG